MPHAPPTPDLGGQAAGLPGWLLALGAILALHYGFVLAGEGGFIVFFMAMAGLALLGWRLFGRIRHAVRFAGLLYFGTAAATFALLAQSHTDEAGLQAAYLVLPFLLVAAFAVAAVVPIYHWVFVLRREENFGWLTRPYALRDPARRPNYAAELLIRTHGLALYLPAGWLLAGLLQTGNVSLWAWSRVWMPLGASGWTLLNDIGAGALGTPQRLYALITFILIGAAIYALLRTVHARIDGLYHAYYGPPKANAAPQAEDMDWFFEFDPRTWRGRSRKPANSDRVIVLAAKRRGDDA